MAAALGGDPNSGLTGIPAMMGLTAVGLAKALNGSVPLGTKEEEADDTKLGVAMPVEPNGDGDGWASVPRGVEFEDVAPNPHEVVVDPKEKVGAVVTYTMVSLVGYPDPKVTDAKGDEATGTAGVLEVLVFPSNDPKAATVLESSASTRVSSETTSKGWADEGSSVESYGCSMCRGVLGRGAMLWFMDDTGMTKPWGSFSF